VPNTFIRIPDVREPYFIKTNKQSFRSNFDYAKKKILDKRIVFLGDSYTAGDGVPNEKRFSDLLSEEFKSLETYNFGLSGSGIDQQVLIYETIVKNYDHDIICFSPHLEDINRLGSYRIYLDRNTEEKYQIPKPYFTLENEKLILQNVPVPLKRKKLDTKIGLLDKEYAIHLFHKKLPKTVKEIILKRRYSGIFGLYNDETSSEWQLMRALIYRLIEKSDNKTILLCPTPDSRIYDYPSYQQRFIEIEKKYDNVFFVDLAEHFGKLSRKERWDMLPLSTGHYNRFGHRVIADAIKKALVENSLVSKSSKLGGRSSNTNSAASNNYKKDVYILGISAFYHDSASALIKNGKIIAATQEERFSRVKHDSGFPSRAINYCLEEGRIHVSDLDAIVFYDNPMLSLERILSSQIAVAPEGEEIWVNMVPRWIQTKLRIPEIIKKRLNYNGKIFFVEHHMSHAASTFFASPFDEAAILTIDGVGEWATACIGHGKDADIEIMKQIEYPHSLGLLYSAFTYFTGFRVNNGEYKFMGLAPYGEPRYVDIIKEYLIDIKEDGSIRLNMKYFGYLNKLCMINEHFHELFGGPPREPDSPITQREMDIAKSVQVVTEEIILKMANHAYELTRCDYLCMAGGVALNCVANGKVLRESKFKDIWIQPAAGDAGGSLGAALYIYYAYSNNKRVLNKEHPSIQRGSYWGPEFSNDEVVSILNSYGYKYRKVEGEKRSKLIAKYISEGKVVGHFSGRMEFGPRALGARSILGNPRDEKMQSILNLKIKYRESFRPFAPTVLVEDIHEYFDINRPSPYMLLVAGVKKERRLPTKKEDDFIKRVKNKRSDLPAITHVDYSARIQSIDRMDHQVYYDVIKEFKNLTGYGVVVNTSFNVRGEPIVCTPYEALNCFMNTEMDVLAINDYILLKSEQKNPFFEKREKIIESRKMPPKTKDILKLEKKALRLFSRYILPISNTVKNCILNLDFKVGNNETYWKPHIIKKSYWEYDFTVGESPNKETEYIMSIWGNYSDKEKELLNPLVQELVTLKNKIKLEDIVLGEGVYGSIYVMF